MRIFQKIVLHGLKLGRFLIAEHSRHKPGNGIDHDHRGKFPAGQYIISDGHVVRHDFLQYPLIDSLVMAAQKDQLLLLGKFFYHSLVKYLSLRSQVNTARLFSGCPGKGSLCHRSVGPVDRLRLDDHTGASAIRVIIHPVVFVIREIPDIDRMQGNVFVFHCPSDNACIEPLFHHLRKQRQHMKIHERSLLSN